MVLELVKRWSVSVPEVWETQSLWPPRARCNLTCFFYSGLGHWGLEKLSYLTKKIIFIKLSFYLSLTRNTKNCGCLEKYELVAHICLPALPTMTCVVPVSHRQPPWAAVVKLHLWIAKQAVHTSQGKYQLTTVGKEPWESVLVQVFREADAKIGLNMSGFY